MSDTEDNGIIFVSSPSPICSSNFYHAEYNIHNWPVNSINEPYLNALNALMLSANFLSLLGYNGTL